MFYKSLLRPLLFRLPPETAHELSLRTLAAVLRPETLRKAVCSRLLTSPFGPLKRFGLTFDNPVGLAAGLDKNATATSALAALGFGFVEVGSVTNFPQPGSPKPRLFRLPLDKALINRAGFNNDGTAVVCQRLSRGRPSCVLGINIGKSKVVDLKDAEADYLASFELAHSIADYVVVNVSSPNTPNLRELQRPAALNSLLRSLQAKNFELSGMSNGRSAVPVLVKIAPDLTGLELAEIVDIVLETGIAGIIATNTTVGRSGLKTQQSNVETIGAGGLSGAPLRDMSTGIVANLFRLTKGRIPIVGTGGVFTAEDAWEKICAGASLIQLYTGMIYEGPLVAWKINRRLKSIFDDSGFETLDEAIGSRSEEFTVSPLG
jgi:dihydroorotate dehydrogenase